MSNVSMMIQIDSEMNDKLAALAKQNRRSKRMEVMAALDLYVQMAGNQTPQRPYDQEGPEAA